MNFSRMNNFGGVVSRANGLWRQVVGLGQWTPSHSGRRYDQTNRNALLSLVIVGVLSITMFCAVQQCAAQQFVVPDKQHNGNGLLHGREECPAQTNSEFGIRNSELSIRLSALSQIESGDCDMAVGMSGEVSRYQILPMVWRNTTNGILFDLSIPTKYRDLSPTNTHQATQVAWFIATARMDNFEKRHRRPPADFEFYKLWNPHCPDETAQRFANLCEAIKHQDTKAPR